MASQRVSKRVVLDEGYGSMKGNVSPKEVSKRVVLDEGYGSMEGNVSPKAVSKRVVLDEGYGSMKGRFSSSVVSKEGRVLHERSSSMNRKLPPKWSSPAFVSKVCCNFQQPSHSVCAKDGSEQDESIAIEEKFYCCYYY